MINEDKEMATYKALMAVFLFTAASGWGLLRLGVGEHHSDPLWALGTSIALITILLVDVWMFFAIAKEEPFRWE
ncbi:MAG: hypothetical protein G8D61_17235 [gamma proteobacterium symbiont of Ctena orbiculata]|nr:MAG: hypothetical protein DBP03_16960 [gamma proteobacterium symbiont of Ctena orbiculata]